MTIQPNHKDMQCHLDKLFSRCENDYPGALIQIDSAKENGHWSSEYFNVGERDKAVEYAAKENLDGRNVYVVQLRRHDRENTDAEGSRLLGARDATAKFRGMDDGAVGISRKI